MDGLEFVPIKHVPLESIELDAKLKPRIDYVNDVCSKTYNALNKINNSTMTAAQKEKTINGLTKTLDDSLDISNMNTKIGNKDYPDKALGEASILYNTVQNSKSNTKF